MVISTEGFAEIVVVGISQTPGDVDDLIRFVLQQFPGAFHAKFQDIFIDCKTIFVAEQFGQIFDGEEIFFCKHGNLDILTVIAFDIFFDDTDHFFWRDFLLCILRLQEGGSRVDS